MEIISSNLRTAQKEHICSYCGLPIKKGEKYRDDYIKGDEAYRWRSHLTCEYLVKKLDMDTDNCGEGLTSTAFTDYIRDFCKKNNFYGKTGEERMEFVKAKCLESEEK